MSEQKVRPTLRYPSASLITTGSHLGPYEVTAQLGAGGMGEVFKARDSRLDRTVAIKVLPARLSSDARFRERFEREAKAISALSHPHICTLYDVGSHDGADYLVMEYLEGESLAERLAKGPLSIDQVIRYGSEIADALEKAHRIGIVHRDLKPGNVIITKSGAKLLDFGLAKFSPAGHTDPHAATAAKASEKPLTEEGTVLGTFQYMAPEQIEGLEADARTDIFALGALLYEMATGRRAFEGKTRASLIASILDREPPPVSNVQPMTPPALERVIRMCLHKDPDERWQNAHDVSAELQWIGATSSETIGPGVKRRARRTRLRGAALLAAGVVTGGLAAWLLTGGDAPPPPTVRFAVTTPPDAPLYLDLNAFSISPDGNYILYRSIAGNTSRLYLRAMNGLAAVPVAGTDDVQSFAFSPDGRWIAFMTQDGLWRMPREGGTPSRLADEVDGLGLDWHDNTIVFNRAFSGGLLAVPADGGTPRQIVKNDPAKKENAIVWPDVLPGGKHVIATVWNIGAWDNARIIAYSMTDGSSKVLIDGGSFARYSSTGHLLFMRGDTLMAVAFDPETLTVAGTPAAVVDGISHGTADGDAHFAVSEAGHLAYAPGTGQKANDQLLWIDLDGKTTPMVPSIRRYGSVDISPDGRTAAVTIEESTYDIWQLDLDRDSLTRVSHGGDDLEAVWTADGNGLIWVSSRSGAYNLYWRSADNSTPEVRLAPSEGHQWGASVTGDGKYVVYGEAGKKKMDLWMMPLDTRKPQVLLATDFNEVSPVVSPDGRWLAYGSDQSGRGEIYVTSFPKPSGSTQVSTEGGSSPRWMPDSRAIVYEIDRKFFIVPIESGPRPRAGRPRLLFEGPYDDEFSITGDGRFAIVKEGPHPTATQFIVVLNWAEELKQRLPAR